MSSTPPVRRREYPICTGHPVAAPRVIFLVAAPDRTRDTRGERREGLMDTSRRRPYPEGVPGITETVCSALDFTT